MPDHQGYFRHFQFSDMYHYYSCNELDTRRDAIIRRLTCNCEACGEIQEPWASVIDAKNQERLVKD